MFERHEMYTLHVRRTSTVLPDSKRCAFFDEPVLPEKWTSETQRPRQTHYLDLVSRLSKKSSAPDNSFSLYFGTYKKCISI